MSRRVVFAVLSLLLASYQLQSANAKPANVESPASGLVETPVSGRVEIPAFSQVESSVTCPVGKALNLPVTEWSNKSQTEPKAIVVAVHGLTLYAGAFDQMATHLAKGGYTVYALDMRGFGRWMTDARSFGGDERIHVSQSQADLLALVNKLRATYPGKKLYFMGESQGSNLAMWMIENHPELSDGAMLASPCYHTRIHPTFRWIADGASELFKFNHPMNLEPYTRPYLTNDPALTEKCDNDPLVNRVMTPEELVKCLIENRKAIKNADLIPEAYPILMVAGAKDAVFKPKQLAKRIKKFGDYREISFTLLPGKGHLLIEHQSVNPTIGKLMDTWLDEQTTPASSIVKMQTPRATADSKPAILPN